MPFVTSNHYRFLCVFRGKHVEEEREVSSDEETHDIRPRTLWPDIGEEEEEEEEANNARKTYDLDFNNEDEYDIPPFDDQKPSEAARALLRSIEDRDEFDSLNEAHSPYDPNASFQSQDHDSNPLADNFISEDYSAPGLKGKASLHNDYQSPLQSSILSPSSSPVLARKDLHVSYLPERYTGNECESSSRPLLTRKQRQDYENQATEEIEEKKEEDDEGQAIEHHTHKPSRLPRSDRPSHQPSAKLHEPDSGFAEDEEEEEEDKRTENKYQWMQDYNEEAGADFSPSVAEEQSYVDEVFAGEPDFVPGTATPLQGNPCIEYVAGQRTPPHPDCGGLDTDVILFTKTPAPIDRGYHSEMVFTVMHETEGRKQEYELESCTPNGQWQKQRLEEKREQHKLQQEEEEYYDSDWSSSSLTVRSKPAHNPFQDDRAERYSQGIDPKEQYEQELAIRENRRIYARHHLSYMARGNKFYFEPQLYEEATPSAAYGARLPRVLWPSKPKKNSSKRQSLQSDDDENEADTSITEEEYFQSESFLYQQRHAEFPVPFPPTNGLLYPGLEEEHNTDTPSALGTNILEPIANPWATRSLQGTRPPSPRPQPSPRGSPSLHGDRSPSPLPSPPPPSPPPQSSKSAQEQTKPAKFTTPFQYPHSVPQFKTTAFDPNMFKTLTEGPNVFEFNSSSSSSSNNGSISGNGTSSSNSVTSNVSCSKAQPSPSHIHGRSRGHSPDHNDAGSSIYQSGDEDDNGQTTIISQEQDVTSTVVEQLQKEFREKKSRPKEVVRPPKRKRDAFENDHFDNGKRMKRCRREEEEDHVCDEDDTFDHCFGKRAPVIGLYYIKEQQREYPEAVEVENEEAIVLEERVDKMRVLRRRPRRAITLEADQ
ncbi:hypothetical protein BX616_009954 [Lobosporangium transversale]|uniref:Uncharacterized protein n=1 Tax=Lobosporangium transversale TaxID=64571 RepID=A0A1Y2GSC7_9FUNG|nr:hypothetical protein BCR41DRAFT_42537 [Lobosporangium transversale]KAF9913499.1 hypothetical protein BX616_009954 [Lobosporangium transversale]ORZ19260.1 hypothetical protein BCR41DRAFT_42537 [Lobosporangium transversale]|eukprot:XP_021882428.1 hypothetical protein BCR41DRAFT_42537 [Lobosporangium transversale]